PVLAKGDDARGPLSYTLVDKQVSVVVGDCAAAKINSLSRIIGFSPFLVRQEIRQALASHRRFGVQDLIHAPDGNAAELHPATTRIPELIERVLNRERVVRLAHG